MDASRLAGLSKFHGMDVVETRPMLWRRERTWRERLFSWPWRPWQRTELALEPPICKPGEYLVVGRTIYVGPPRTNAGGTRHG